MDRAAFLGRIRERLTHAHDNVAHPIVPVDGVPAVRYAQSLDDPVAAFTEAATNLGVVVRACAGPDDAASFLATIGSRTVCCSRDPEVELLRGRLPEIAPEHAELGIVGASWGIAATGTVVFDAGRAGRRAASLLPPAVLVLVRAANILPSAAEVLRAMPERFPEGPPSQLVFATGPSRSGDIELELTTGVHGPGRVFIAVLP